MLQPNVDNTKAQKSSSAGLEGLRRERENLQSERPRLEDGLARARTGVRCQSPRLTVLHERGIGLFERLTHFQNFYTSHRLTGEEKKAYPRYLVCTKPFIKNLSMKLRQS